MLERIANIGRITGNNSVNEETRCGRRVWLHSIEFFRIYIFNEGVRGWGCYWFFAETDIC